MSMDKRILAMLSLAVVMAAMAVPMLASDESHAAGAEDIQITLPGGSQDVEVAVSNGSSETFTIYVYNNSADYLMMDVAAEADSGYLDIEPASTTYTLSPNGTSEWGHMATVEFTVTVDEYETGNYETGTIVLTFYPLDGGSAPFTRTIGVTVTVDSAYYSEDGTNKFLGVFPNTFDGALGSEWFTALVTIVVWVIISFIVCWVVVPLFTRIFAKNSSDEEKRRLRKSLTSLVVLLIAVLSIGQCLTILGAGPEVQGSFDRLSGVIYTIIGALIIWVIYDFVITAVLRGMERGSDSAIDTSLIPLFKMIGKLVITVGALAAVLAAFGVDLTGILVSAGVVTLGITLGAQNVLQQFFSGIVLLATRPFKAGDYVEINGTVYVVRKVKLMFTEFDNDDYDRVVTIPNDVVSGGTIVNMTGEDEDTAVYVYINVAYGADLALARRLMVQAAEENPRVVKDGSRSAPSTRMTAVNDSTVELRLCAYIDDYKLNGGVAGELRARIFELFLENGIETPSTDINVNIREA